MDFFERQAIARRNTRRLVILFGLAVILIVVAVYLSVFLIFFTREIQAGGEAPGLWRGDLFLAVAAGTLLIIFAGSAYKTAQLASGGETVARLLGGRPVDPNTPDLQERRILNVVEEMAIASGTPVPTVFLLDRERSINAFAAGFGSDDAVIGVTKGTARLLSRDELQGVMAHEFSHILNGDMRLNLRLMGILHGILVLSLIGYWMMRIAGRSSGGRKKGGSAAIALLGLALFIIGYVGVFFGRLIKAGVSRQREFLADAAAVQFTRNPGGIAGALKKIGGYTLGSRLDNPKAEEASHLYFSYGLKTAFLGLLSTHPPLDERIRRIEPAFDGRYPRVEWPKEAAAPKEPPVPERPTAKVAPVVAAAATAVIHADQVAKTLGTLTRAHLNYAVSLLAQIPEGLREALHEPFGSRAVIYGLLLDPDPEVRKIQMEELVRASDPAILEETQKILPLLDPCPPEARLPLLDLALPALRRLSPAQYQEFRQVVRRLVEADRRVSLFEYALHRAVLRHLEPHFGKARRAATQYDSFRSLGREVSCLLSALAYAGHRDLGEAREAFMLGARVLADTGAEIEFLEPAACGLKAIDEALNKLALLAPRLKKQLLQALAAAVGRDGLVTREEGELLRAMADSLEAPVPPLLPGQRAET